jgi:hypothetical protein
MRIIPMSILNNVRDNAQKAVIIKKRDITVVRTMYFNGLTTGNKIGMKIHFLEKNIRKK